MPDAFDRAEALFHDALELSADARASFLRAQCGGDAALAARVARLLTLHDEAEAVLAPPPTRLVLAAAGETTTTEDLVGQTLGPFRLLRLLGAGGMGAVYLAEQAHPRRQVALKVLRASLLSPHADQRFTFEVDVLAALDHPGIARLLEAGVGETAHGPVRYLAMEFVAGRSFRSCIDDANLELHARLPLMADLCAAVGHAHGKGIVHRDLKPENVLVNEERDASGATRLRPRVLDFGIAKSLGDAVLSRPQTMIGQILGTVDYMSPEQIDGRPAAIDARTDVYALGVMLYQLVTGRMPYDLRGSSFTEAARIIRQEEPLSAGKLVRALRGDVETVVGKALAKEPAHRYRDALELEQDLRRILRGEPIMARPPSTLVSLRKWVGRNRLVAGLAASLFTAIVGGLVLSTTLWLTTATAQEEAAARAAEAEETVRFLESIFEQASPTHEMRGRTSVRDVVAQATQRVTTELRTHPTLRARILAKLGRVNDWVENSGRGVDLLREAIALREGAAVGDDEVCQWRLALGQALHHADRLEEAASALGSLVGDLRQRNAPRALLSAAVTSHGWALERLSRYAEAEPLLREALVMQRALGDLGDVHDLIEALNCNASLLADTDRNAEALPLFEECAQRCEHGGARGQMRLPYVLNNIARCETALGRFAPAEAHVERGLELARHWFDEDHPLRGDLLSTLGSLHFAAGSYAKSIATHRQALELRERIFEARSGQIAWSLNDLACALLELNLNTEAATQLERALAIYETARGSDSALTVSCRSNLAMALARTGSAERAEALARQAIETCSRLSLGSRSEAAAWHALAVALEASSRFDEAMVAMGRAIALREGIPDAAWLRGISRQLQAYYANRRGDHAGAEVFARAAIAELRNAASGNNEPLANAIYQRGWAEWREGRVQDAMVTLRESVELYRRACPQGSWLMTYALSLLGHLLVADGSADGLGILCEACQMREALSPDHVETAEMFETLGRVRLRLGLRDDATAPLLRAHEIFSRTLAADDARITRVRGELRLLYEALGRQEEAAKWR